MELKFIEKLVQLVNENDIDLIEYNHPGEKLRIVRRHPPSAAIMSQAPALTQPVLQTPDVVREETKAKPRTTKTEVEQPSEMEASGANEITSPMVGTFYKAPAPDADPYVRVGDKVKNGQTLCIIEAMKLMNEIQAEYSGKIVKILVKNAQPVEFGQPLFHIEKE